MAGRFTPTPTPDTQFYWDKTALGELWLPHCNHCDHAFFYPRAFCPTCGGDDVSWVQASGRGVVESFVINHRPAPGYEDVSPYVIALVLLDEGVRLTSNILEVEQTPEAVTVGLPVEVVFETRGELTLPQFRPISNATTGA